MCSSFGELHTSHLRILRMFSGHFVVIRFLHRECGVFFFGVANRMDHSEGLQSLPNRPLSHAGSDAANGWRELGGDKSDKAQEPRRVDGLLQGVQIDMRAI